MNPPEIFIIGIFGVPLFFGAVALFLFGKRPKYKPKAILFHSISSKHRLNASQVSVDSFRCFLKLVAESKYTTLTIQQMAFAEKKNDMGKLCAITFDDGFDSFYTYAIPELEIMKFKATVFVVVGYVGAKSSWDIYSSHQHLSADQIKIISSLGHEIGSHTLTHPNLVFLNRRDLVRELKESKFRLEDIIGKEVLSLSFPFGSWNKRIWNTALDIGYKAATIYRGHHLREPGLIPVYGSFSFHTPSELFSLIGSNPIFSITLAQARIMPHFSKGTPIWKFRKQYYLKPDYS